MKDKKKVCSFCGLEETEDRKIFSSVKTDSFICSECAKSINAFLNDIDGDSVDFSKPNENERHSLNEFLGQFQIEENESIIKNDDTFDLNLDLKPQDIKKQLDQYVVGQEYAKKVLSVAVYNHYKRLINEHLGEEKDCEIDKSNVIMLGPSGCGKTLLAKTLAQILNVPFAIADATNLTAAGYYGGDVESILQKLLVASDYNLNAAERGIVYIDEFDKLGRKTDVPRSGRDIGGEAVQQELLKIIEGSIVNIPVNGRSNPMTETVNMNTKNILFICGGSFEGLLDIVKSRLGGQTIGFNVATQEIKALDPYQEINQEDIRKFGIIPELVGRLPIITYLEPLSEEQMVNVLTEPKNALLKQYQTLFEMDHVQLNVTEEALKAFAHKAHTTPTGVRSLRSMFEKVMMDTMYDLPNLPENSCVTIDEDVVLGKTKAKISQKNRPTKIRA